MSIDCLNDQSKNISIIQAIFESNHGVEGGALKIINCLNSYLTSTKFIQNNAQTGGGIYLDNRSNI